MKTLFLFLSWSFTFINAFSNNPEELLTHQIDAVTIFLNSAEIARSAEIQIPQGRTDLIFKGISIRMIEQGIKLSISDDVKVFAVNKEKNKNVLEESENFQEFETLKQTMSREESKLLMQISILEKELQYYESNMKLQKNNAVSFLEIDEGATYFRKKITTIHEEIEAVKIKIESFSKKEKLFLKEYEELRLKTLKTATIIRITVESEKAVAAKVNLKYLVTNALWKPYYSVRASDESSNVLIEYQAKLYNDTGNDWDNKPISLAILDSSDDVSKPELEIWTLEESNTFKKSNKRSSSSRSRSSVHDKANREEEYTELQVDDLSTRFDIKESHLIPSDATPHLIDIISYNKEVEFYNLSIPKVKNGAFLIARIKDWESLGLIDGDINLYYNDTYQGISQLKTNEINDTLDLSMGKENNFIVSRKKVSSSSRKNLIGFNIKEVLTYEIKIKNNKTEAASIELRDQLPISISKDVEVKAIDLSRGKLDPLTGQVTWNIDVQANEVKTILLRYSIKYPKSKRDAIRFKSKVIVSPRYF